MRESQAGTMYEADRFRGNQTWKGLALRLVAVVGFLGPMALLPGDWLGWATLALAAALPWISRTFRQSVSTFRSGVLVSVSVIAAAIVNSYFEPLPGGGADGERFIRIASWHAEHGGWPEYAGGSSAFVIVLTFLFSVFGASVLSVHALNALGSVILLGLVARLRKLLGPRAGLREGMLYLVAFLPSAFVFRAAPLREAWEAVFFTGAVLTGCQAFVGFSIGRLVRFALFGFGAALLHAALAVAVLLMSVLILGKAVLDRKVTRVYRVLASLGAVLLILPAGYLFWMLAVRDGRVESFAEAALAGDVEQAAEVLEGRGRGGATYMGAPGMQGNLIIRMFAGAFYYWLAPLPWQVRTAADLLAVGENLVRVSLLVVALLQWRRSKGRERQIVGFALAAVMTSEFVWSTGTSNWGTALRHHIPALGVLCGCGYPWANRRRWKS